VTLRKQKRFEARGRTARLRHNASIEDVDYRVVRGLDRTLFLKLAGCDFVREHASARAGSPARSGHKACREDFLRSPLARCLADNLIERSQSSLRSTVPRTRSAWSASLRHCHMASVVTVPLRRKLPDMKSARD
jgi:hypothetical protein